MTTLARRQRFSFPEIPEWFDTLPARFAMPTVGDLFTIRIEDFMQDDRYVVRAELPGMSPEDIDVAIGDGMLTIKAERTEEDREKNRSEIRYGSMSRSMTLPPGADENDVRAAYTDGMLTISVGMGSDKTEPKHIEIQHST